MARGREVGVGGGKRVLGSGDPPQSDSFRKSYNLSLEHVERNKLQSTWSSSRDKVYVQLR